MANPCSGCERAIQEGNAIPVYIIECNEDGQVNVEIVCSPEDGRPLIVVITNTNPPTVEYFEIDGTTPYVGPTPVSCTTNITETTSCWIAVADGVSGDYSVDDQLSQIQFWDTDTVPPTLVATVWFNNNTNLIIPTANVDVDDLISCSVTSDYEHPPTVLCDYSQFTGLVVGHAWWEVEFNADGSIGTQELVGTNFNGPPGIIDRPYVIQGDLLPCDCTELKDDFCGLQLDQETIEFDVQAGENVEIITATIGLSNVTQMIIDWGDGNTDQLINLNIIGHIHNYANPGTYTISFVANNNGTTISRSVDIDTTVLGIVAHNEVNPNTYEYIRYTYCNGVVRWLLKYNNFFVGEPDTYFPCLVSDEQSTATLSVGYIEICDSFDLTLPINQVGTFSDGTGTTETLSTTNQTATLIASQLDKALFYENSETNNGLTVTNFIIRTEDGSIFEFPPSAFEGNSGTTLSFTTADLVNWPGPLNDTITQIKYSIFDNCDCIPVEMLQEVDPTTNDVTLLKVLDPSVIDQNGVKSELSIPLEFGVSGPYPGPCPSGIQVIELNPLCCNDDLLNNNPDIANQRLAWLDGADPLLMLDAVGGVPIAGNDGDNVFEVQDKINPGVAPSFRIPATGAPGDIAPINPPSYQTNIINGLSVLEFDSANRERLRLDTNNGNGNSFSLFYLVSATDPVLADNACILAVGPAGTSDGDRYIVTEGSWQLSRDGDAPSFILRLEMNPAEFALGVDPPMIVQTGPFSNESSPANPQNPTLIERAIATKAEFFDGQIHLITVQFDNATGILSCFFDGALRTQIDFGGFPLTSAAMGSDYFRLFGNRAGTRFLSGQVAEIFFADAFLTPEETAIVNAYLICKWGIDPSLAAGGAGDLTLAPPGTYNSPTSLVQVLQADGTIIYRNTETSLQFTVPPVPGLSICAGDGELGFDVECKCFEDANQQFIRHTVYDVETGSVANVFDTEMDMTTTYNTIGNESPCSDGGTIASVNVASVNVEPRYTLLGPGPATWTMGTSVHSVTITNLFETPTGTNSTVETAEGTFDLFLGQSITFSTHEADRPLQQPIVVTVHDINDRVAINWVQEV